MLFTNRLTIQDTCRQTNTTFPVKSYLTSTSFPSQDASKIGTHLYIQYRDFNFNTQSEEDMGYRLIPAKIYVLRYDTEFPFTIIGIGINNRIKGQLIVLKRTHNSEELHDLIGVYSPEQRYNYYLKDVSVTYSDFSNLANCTHGKVLRCDDAEPSYSVIVEILDDTYIRFITSDEAICLIDDFAPKSPTHNELDGYDLVEQLLGEYIIYGTTTEEDNDGEE